MDEATIIRRLSDGRCTCVVAYLEVILQLVNGDLVFTGIVLQGTCEEGLREEEARDPECGRRTLLDPLSEEVDPLIEIIDPGGKRLERKEADIWLPSDRHLVIEQRVRCGIKLFGHDDFSD